MAERPDTLRDLLLPAGPDRSPDRLRELETSDKLSEVRKKLESRSRDVRWPGLPGLVLGKLGELLDIGIFEGVFVKVWNEAKLFRKYLDPDTYPAGETIEVPILEHTVRSTHRPHLEVRLDEVLIDRIDFEISVTLELKGAILEIRDAKIERIRAGELRGSGEVTCEGLRLLSEKFEPVQLPGSKVFAPAMAIDA